MKKGSFLPYLAGIGSAVIFGFSFLFTKEALQVTRPIYFLAYRFTIAFIFISLLAIVRLIRIRLSKILFKELLPLIFVQPLLYFTMEAMGVQRTTSSVAGLMISTIPVFVLILAHIFLGERLKILQVVSIFVALSGVILITLSRGGEFGAEFLGIIFLFVSTFSAALYNILSRQASLKAKPIEITYVMMFAGFVGFNAIAFMQSLALNELNNFLTSFIHPQIVISALYLGTLSSTVAFFLINYTLSKLPASKASVFPYLSTVVTLFAGILIRGEKFAITGLFGAILILIGVYGVNRLSVKHAPKRRLKR